MSWKDKLLDASYKGIRFKVEESKYEFGRRTELKQFANNDSPELQDFGADASEFTINAFIISNKENDYDYIPERNALIAAFNEFTGLSAKLIHPYYGELDVYPVGRAEISESINEGGMARIVMKFVRINEEDQKLILPSYKKQPANITIQGLPTTSKDFNSTIDDATNLADNDAGDNFVKLFNQGRAFIDKLRSVVVGGLQKIQEAIYKIKGTISSLTAFATGTLSVIIFGIDTIIDSPAMLFNGIKNAVNSISNICGMGVSQLLATGGEVGGYSGTVRGDIQSLDGETIPDELGVSTINELLNVINTLNDENSSGFIPSAQLTNIICTTDIIKYCIYSTMMQIAIRINFLNQEKLLEYTNLISAAIDDFLYRLGAETDESNYEYIEGDYLDNTLLFTAMEDLRNLFIQAMYVKAVSVSTIIDYEISPEIITVLQLAYEKYEDLNREEEVYNMNRLEIRHPGFLPAGGHIRILNE